MSRFVSIFLIVMAMIAPAHKTVSADEFLYDPPNYSFKIDNVPDLDQKRESSRDGTVDGLPNGGKMHCVPTSAINWMAYIANHGYPNLGPGPGDWEVSPPGHLAEYNYITGTIFLMGLLMHTDPVNGTGGVKDAVQLYLDTAYPDHFIVAEVFAQEDWSPRARDASLMTLFGGLVDIAMGWYTNADEPEAHMRKGGHVVTLMEGIDDGTGYRIMGLRDPAWTPNDDTLQTQSNFINNHTGFHPETEYFCGQDANGFPANCYIRTQDRLTYTGSGYMDGYLAIIPIYGLSYNTLGELLLLKPIQLSGRDVRVVQRFPTSNKRNVLDLALNPIRVKHPYLIDDTDDVWQIDPLTGESSRFATVRDPLRLTYGGTKENLYVLKPHQLQCFDRQGRRTQNIGLQSPLDAIAFDERNQTLVGLSRSSRRLYLFDSSLRRLGSVPVPDEVFGGEGRLTLSIDPSTGEMWTLFEGARYISHFELNEERITRLRQITLPDELLRPQGLYVNEKGEAFVTGDGRIFPLDENGRIKRAAPFYGLEAGAGLQIARPFTNFDPATMVGPAFFNVLPEDADRIVRN